MPKAMRIFMHNLCLYVRRCYVVPGIYGIWRLGSFVDGMLIFGAFRYIVELHATWYQFIALQHLATQ